jgi:hypothetical protein
MAERISFARSLYSPEAIEAAGEAYADFAKIAVEESGDDLVVVIDDVAEHDPALVAHAFANHALHETITRRRQTAIDEA